MKTGGLNANDVCQFRSLPVPNDKFRALRTEARQPCSSALPAHMHSLFSFKFSFSFLLLLLFFLSYYVYNFHVVDVFGCYSFIITSFFIKCE